MLLDASDNHPATTENTVPVAPWKNPAAGQNPQLQIVPWVPGQPKQGPLFQPWLVMCSPLQKPEDGLDAELQFLLLPSASGRTPQGRTSILV